MRLAQDGASHKSCDSSSGSTHHVVLLQNEDSQWLEFVVQAVEDAVLEYHATEGVRSLGRSKSVATSSQRQRQWYPNISILSVILPLLN